jgi:putative cardiolipin synthase
VIGIIRVRPQLPIGSTNLGIIRVRPQLPIGSTNLDPRSLNLNTEMGLLIKSSEFNKLVREVVALDFHQRNAWHLQAHEDGSLRWVADDTVLDEQPAESTLQRLEDWFLSILPIEDEM